MTEGYKGRIGNLIRDARKHRGLTQHQLAELLATSQSAINRIEKGHQNLSLEMLARIGAALDSEIVWANRRCPPPRRDRELQSVACGHWQPTPPRGCACHQPARQR